MAFFGGLALPTYLGVENKTRISSVSSLCAGEYPESKPDIGSKRTGSSVAPDTMSTEEAPDSTESASTSNEDPTPHRSVPPEIVKKLEALNDLVSYLHRTGRLDPKQEEDPASASLWTAEDVAEHLSVPYDTVLFLFQERKLRGLSIGGKLRFLPQHVTDYVRRQVERDFF